MARLDNADNIIGTEAGADFALTLGAYKTADEKVRYLYGCYFNYPAVVREMAAGEARNLAEFGARRVVSADGASIVNKNVEHSPESVLAWHGQINAEGILARLHRERERKAPVAKMDTVDSLAVRILTRVVLAKAGIEPQAATKEQTKEAGQTARKMRIKGHKWYAVARKKAEAAMAEKGFED
jgi:hypothetical protein